MPETTWPEIGGKELRYRDHTWKLTGEVDVREQGRVLAVEARQTDDVKHETAFLYFDVETEDSLNPGDLGEHFDRLERTADGQSLVVRKHDKTYRYKLHRLEYE
jgi:hypothetical protein